MNTEDFKELKMLNIEEEKRKGYFQRSLKYFKEIPKEEIYTKYRNSYIEIFSDFDKLKSYRNQVANQLEPQAEDANDYWNRDSSCVGGSMKGYWEPSDFSKCRDPIRKYLISVIQKDSCTFLTYSPKDDDVKSLLQKCAKFWKSKYITEGSFYALEFYCHDMKFRPHAHFWLKKSCDETKMRQHIKRTFGEFPAVKLIFNYDDIANGMRYIRTPNSDSKKEQKAADVEYRTKESIPQFFYKT